MADTTLAFNVLATDNATRTVGKIGQSFGNLHLSVGKVMQGLVAVGPALAGLAVGAGVKQFITDARESARVGRLTAQVIKSTGGAARITADQVGDLANAISNKTGADDEAIQSGQNLLLTFTNIRNGVGKGNDIFNQASQAITDMTAAMNGGEVTAEGMKTSSIQLGKALNDPIKGVTALQKVGVSFTQQQKDQIKTLVDSGKTMEAQKIILAELGKEFGGAAEAAADPLTKLQTIAGNAGEAIGGYLLPVVDKAATFLGKIIPPAVDKATLGIKALGAAFRGEGITSDGFVGAMERVGVVARSISGVLTSNVIPKLRTFGEGLFTSASQWAGKITGGLKTGVERGDWKPLGKALGNGVIAGIKGIGNTAGGLLDAIGALIDKVDWGKLGGKISASITDLLKSIDWKGLGDSLGDALISIFQKATALGDKVGKAFKDLMTRVDWKKIGRDSTDAIGKFIEGVDWGRLAGTLGKAALKSLLLDKKIYDTVTSSAADLVIGIVESIGSAIGKWFSGANKWLEDKGKQLIAGLMQGASSQSSGIGKWLKQHTIDPVVGAFQGAGKWLYQHGKELITGLMDGIWSVAQGIDKWMVRAPVAKLMAPWYGAIKWLVGPGKNIITGLITGIGAAARSLGNWVGRNVISPIVGSFSKAGTWLVQHGKNLVAGLKNGAVSIARGLGNWVGSTIISPVVGAFRTAGSWLVQQGKNLVAGFKNGISSIANSIGRWAYDHVISPAVGPFGKAGTWLVQHGKNLIAGLKNGIVAEMKSIGSWIKGNVVDPVVKAVKTFFGIKSPSKVFQSIGGHLVAGLMKGLATTNGRQIATKVFGDMPSALRSLVGKGLVGLTGLPQKALDALGFGKGMVLPGNMGVLTGENRRVFYQGEAFDLSTYQKLAKAMKLVGGVNVTQGGYENASSYSGTTHTGGGVFDVVGGNLTRILGALKASGLIGWIRNPSQGNWPWHIHALDPSDTGRMSASARGQVADYFRGGDGLGGYKKGTPWVPSDGPAFLHKGEAVIPAEVNKARMAGNGEQRVVLEFRSDGSPHMDYLIREFRKYVRVNGGSVQTVLGRG